MCVVADAAATLAGASSCGKWPTSSSSATRAWGYARRAASSTSAPETGSARAPDERKRNVDRPERHLPGAVLFLAFCVVAQQPVRQSMACLARDAGPYVVGGVGGEGGACSKTRPSSCRSKADALQCAACSFTKPSTSGTALARIRWFRRICAIAPTMACRASAGTCLSAKA